VRYFYDTEFLEDGKTIELISIGIVSSDGREYYAVNSEAPWKRIADHQWLRANVARYLPRIHGDRRLQVSQRRNPMALDFDSPLMKTRTRIASDLVDFIQPQRGTDIELWADYCAYDHVVLCQLFGTMMDLPDGMPMWTHDLEQLWVNAGRPTKPEQGEGQHNALEDARWNAKLYAACAAVKPTKPASDSIKAMVARDMWPLA
jgi:hypothetical protein